MATKLSQTDILEAIDGMTVLELSEFIKAFEERYGVTAAAPAAVAVAARRRRRRRGRGRRGADRVLGRPDRGRPQQDPRHQGRPRADRPRPQGGQGPRRRGPQAGQGGRRQGGGREDQGRPRGAGRQGRDQVAPRCPATGEAGSGLPRPSSGPGAARLRAPAAVPAFDRSPGTRYHTRSVSAAPLFSTDPSCRIPVPCSPRSPRPGVPHDRV